MTYSSALSLGLAIVESRVGEKMAERLVSELGLMFDDAKKTGRRRAFTSIEDLFKGSFDEGVDDYDDYDDEIEEVKLPSGELQSR